MKRWLLICLFLMIFIVVTISAEEYYEFEWDEDDIRNGENFKIKILFFNLEDKEYDVKLWIDDDEDLISDRNYDSEWKSGWFYMNKLVKGPGNFSERVKLRIDDKYEDFKGDAKLYFKIRGKEEIIRDIEVLKKKKEEISEVVEESEGDLVEDSVEDNKSDRDNFSLEDTKIEEDIGITSEVIKLGGKGVNIDNKETEDIKSQNNIVYESKTEIIKKYSVYGFTLLIVIICVLIIWRKLE